MGHEKKKKIESLQILRFVAFFRIFYLHCGAPFHLWGAGNGAAESVSFFFILGGVLIGYNGIERKTNLNIRNELLFVWNKVKKLYPLHIVLLLYFAFFTRYPYLVASCRLEELVRDMKRFLGNMFLVHAWMSYDYYSFNGVSWFLSAMLFMWIISLPLLILLQRVYERWYFKIVCILGVMLSYIILQLWGYVITVNNLNIEWYGYTFPPTRFPEFFSGVLIGCLISKYDNILPSNKAVFYIASIIEVISLLLWMIAPYFYTKGVYGKTLFWIPFNIFIVAAYAFNRGFLSKCFRWKPLVFLGDISGECYLLHQAVNKIYVTSSADNPVVNHIGDVYSFFVKLIMTIILAVFVHNYFRYISANHKTSFQKKMSH